MTTGSEERAPTITVPAPPLSKAILGKDENLAVVYLPPSYGESDMRYPVIYVLPGGGALAKGEDYHAKVASAASAARGAGRAADMIVVVPDHTNALGWPTFFCSSPLNGN